MASRHKTSRGVIVDIDQVRLANEDTIAIGNAKTNARGDQLGSGGKVVKTKILIELYEPKITLDIYKNKNTISLLNKLFEEIYYVKNACKFDVKFECNFEIPTKYSSGLLY